MKTVFFCCFAGKNYYYSASPTYGKIDEERVYKLLENKNSQAGKYRIDSMNYQDVFVYEVNENNTARVFLITGLVKSFDEES